MGEGVSGKAVGGRVGGDYNDFVIVWDEAKRLSNIVKHGYDFAEASLVYNNPKKLELETSRNGEARKLAIALVEVKGKILALVYAQRGSDIRIISFRRASRKEREEYERSQQEPREYD